MGMISVLMKNKEANESTINRLLAEDATAMLMASVERPKFTPTVKFYNSSSLKSDDGYPSPRLEARSGPDVCVVEWKLETRGSQRWLAPFFRNNLSTYITPATAERIRLWASPFERMIEETK